MKRFSTAIFFSVFTFPIFAAGLDFDAGADLRIRQEIMDNVPQCGTGRAGAFRDHIRFRPRVWGELKGDAGEAGKWRIYTRLTDEFRWYENPKNNTLTFPGELIFDNLFIEGSGLFDGLMDVRFGRQDLFNYCGLDHVFMDGTPCDGSRTCYADMAAVKFHVDDDSTIDVFGLYNFDDADDFRWGTKRSKHSINAARFASDDADVNQDDYGYGAVWTSKLGGKVDYQVFAMQKQIKHADYGTHTELVGAKVMPKWNEEFSSAFEVMSEFDEQWSAYADIGWKSAAAGWKPLAKLGYHFMSYEWDPMWSRAPNDSEMFLYGTHNGSAWWSNMHFVKMTAGVEFAPNHRVTASTGPMFVAERDGLGGGSGKFKGLLSQIRYDFPLFSADRTAGERFEVFGHVVAEFFNPGDYYETDRPAWFVRWQLDFRF